MHTFIYVFKSETLYIFIRHFTGPCKQPSDRTWLRFTSRRFILVYVSLVTRSSALCNASTTVIPLFFYMWILFCLSANECWWKKTFEEWEMSLDLLNMFIRLRSVFLILHLWKIIFIDCRFEPVVVNLQFDMTSDYSKSV